MVNPSNPEVQLVETQVQPDVETIMQGTLYKLNMRNQESGGQLFATFGDQDRGNHEKVIIFPTPISRSQINGEGDTRAVASFLIGARDGWLFLDVASTTEQSPLGSRQQRITETIEAQMKKGNADRHKGGLFREVPDLERGISGLAFGDIFVVKQDGRSQISGEDTTGFLRLEAGTADTQYADHVEEAVRVNLERIEKQREYFERTIKPQIDAAHKVNELLSESPA